MLIYKNLHGFAAKIGFKPHVWWFFFVLFFGDGESDNTEFAEFPASFWQKAKTLASLNREVRSERRIKDVS